MQKKRHIVIRIILLSSLVMLIPLKGGEFNKSGRTSLQFLKVGVGARETALGEACIAVVRDVNAAFWNPANITGVQRVEAAFTYSSLYAELNYSAGALGFSFPRLGTLALSVASLDYGNIPEALVEGQAGSHDPRTGDTFTGGDLLVGLSYARNFTDRLSIGLTAKYIEESLFDYNAATYSFDIGSHYFTGFRSLRLAMSAQNFGAEPVKYLKISEVEIGYDVPLLFKFGVSINILGPQEGIIVTGRNHLLQFSVEAINSNDYGERYHYGAEYWFRDFLAVRVGYRQNYAEGNVAFGFGLNPSLAGINVSIDYSYVSYDYLTPPQRFTISVHF